MGAKNHQGGCQPTNPLGKVRHTERRQHDQHTHDEGHSHLAIVHRAAEDVIHTEDFTNLATRSLIQLEEFFSS